MSINGALQIGRSALAASQVGMQVAGNNMANAATPGYTRRSVLLAPTPDQLVARNTHIGRGVDLLDIRRNVDTALQSRLRDALAQEHSAVIDQRFLGALETIQSELTDNDLSSHLSEFFNTFSELANNPEDNAIRSLVIENGATLADRVSSMRSEYGNLRQEIDRTLNNSIDQVNDLLARIEDINVQIAQAEGGQGESGGGAAGLRDHRDQLVEELATYMDIGVVEPSDPNGGQLNIYVGSTPIMLAGQSRSVELDSEQVDGQAVLTLRVGADGTKFTPKTGRIGALLRQNNETVNPATQTLDTLAEQLIFQVNRLHSQGQGKAGIQSVVGTYMAADTTVPVNDDASRLPFEIENGSFFVHITHSDSGSRSSFRVDVDGETMSLDDIAAQINAAIASGGGTGASASVTSAGALSMSANTGYTLSFADDTSGALAALGINTFFTGSDASNMDVNAVLRENPNLLAAGSGHVPGSNGTALAIAGLQDVPLDALDGRSVREFWQQHVSDFAVRAHAAGRAIESTKVVRESLAAQVQAVSGVSLDEESINLMQFQRQFQAAARFIATIDETLQTLLSIA